MPPICLLPSLLTGCVSRYFKSLLFGIPVERASGLQGWDMQEAFLRQEHRNCPATPKENARSPFKWEIRGHSLCAEIGGRSFKKLKHVLGGPVAPSRKSIGGNVWSHEGESPIDTLHCRFRDCRFRA